MQKDMESGPKEEVMVDGKPVMATVTGVNDIDEANADVRACLCKLPASELGSGDAMCHALQPKSAHQSLRAVLPSRGLAGQVRTPSVPAHLVHSWTAPRRSSCHHKG